MSSEALPNSLSSFIDEVDASEKTLLLLNRTKPKPLIDLLTNAFDSQLVTIIERELPEETDNLVCLVEDGRVVATTPLSALEEAFLLVNADRYRTGTRQLESRSFPDVLTGLDDVEFSLRGFPESTKEKLLLIVISRYIEGEALACGWGELHTTFQQLSRLDDERGTRKVYRALADSGVDTHVYGVRDDPTVVDALDVSVHDGATTEHRRSWVVAFLPPSDVWADAVALVATETGPNVWRAMWTYDRSRVRRIQSYLSQHL